METILLRKEHRGFTRDTKSYEKFNLCDLCENLVYLVVQDCFFEIDVRIKTC